MSLATVIEPVGILEIATRLKVKRDTVNKWRDRGLFPPPRWTVGGRPAWHWPEVLEWAEETNRVR